MPRHGQKLGKYHRTEVIDMRRMRRLIERCSSLDYKALFSLLWLTGCRISEALSLTKQDLSVRDQELAIRLKRLKRKDGLVSLVYAPLQAEFCGHLLMYLRQVKSGQLWSYNRTDVWKTLKSFDSELTLHDFRRNRANRFAAKKASIWEMLSFFGWKSTSTPTAYLEKAGGLGHQLSPLLLEEHE